MPRADLLPTSLAPVIPTEKLAAKVPASRSLLTSRVGDRLFGGGVQEGVGPSAPFRPAPAEMAPQRADLAHAGFPTWASTNA